MVTFTRAAGDVDDATGPIRQRRWRKATDLALSKGDIVTFQTGTAVKALSTTFGPYGVVTKDHAATLPEVEVFIQTKATIYVVAAPDCIYGSYVGVDDDGKIVPITYATANPLHVLGWLVNPGDSNYDGVNQPANTLDDDIAGIILGVQ